MNKKSTLRPIRHIASINKDGQLQIAQSNPQILLFNDRKQYLVKFKNSPQGNRMLMRELVCTSIANYLGLPTVPFEIVHISDEFLKKNDLSKHKFTSGSQFASLFLENCSGLWMEPPKDQIINSGTLAGILVFDFWLRNIDRDESNILLRSVGDSHFHIHIIDHGNCFPSQEELLHFINKRKQLYLSSVHKWCISIMDNEKELFAFLQKVHNIEERFIYDLIHSIPDDWLITDEEKKEYYLDILESRQVMNDMVQVLIHYAQKHKR